MMILDAKARSFDDISLVPQLSDIKSRHDVDLSCNKFFGTKMLTPILSANMKTVTDIDMCVAMRNAGGIGTLHRFQSLEELRIQLDQVCIDYPYPLITSVGIGDDLMERLAIAFSYNKSNICIDVAHGHHTRVLETIRKIKDYHDGYFTIIAGNVCTPQATRDLFSAGANLVKIGVGPGSHCTTRVVTGHGVPQLTAIMNCVKVAREYEEINSKPYGIIADGGIRNSGDIARAIAAGADYVMIGRLLAGCLESPAEAIMRPLGMMKVYRGSASFEAQRGQRNTKKIITEGVQSEIPYCGTVANVIGKLSNGLRSALSYSGSHNLKEFREKAIFVRVTPGGHLEGTPHGAF